MLVAAAVIPLVAGRSDRPRLSMRWANRIVSTQKAPSGGVDIYNSGYPVERSACLTIAIGPSAASECGDLRVVHQLPSVRTYNTVRTPTLLYNHQYAHPYPALQLLVTQSSTTTTPDSVEVKFWLTINGVDQLRATQRWGGGTWQPGVNSTRRITVIYDGLSDTTGYYLYKYEIANIYGGVRLANTPQTGIMPIINRKDSWFGAGWSLAGLEELIIPGTSEEVIVWVDGDGSARQFLEHWSIPNFWYTSYYSGTDSLKYNAGTPTTPWTRYGRGGVQVKFDALGRHVQTRDRLGRTTTFAHGTDTLTVTLPPAGQQYKFAHPSNKLTAVIAPTVNGQSRVTTITNPSGQILAIRSPGDSAVQFAYRTGTSDVNIMARRTAQSGAADTFGYNSGRRLLTSRLKMPDPADDIVWHLIIAESRGRVPTTYDTTEVTTRIDGPRTDVPDTTAMLQSRFGPVRRLLDAYGNITLVHHDWFSWDPLRIQTPAGRVQKINYGYNTGNPTSIVDSVTTVSGQSDTTRYEWNDPFDQLTKIVPPEKDSTVFWVNAASGRRDSAQDVRGSSTRVRFSYTTDNQVATMSLPVAGGGSAVYMYAYDSRQKNLASATTAKGYITSYVSDSIGRVTKTQGWIDTVGTSSKRVEKHFGYDLLGRVIADTTLTTSVTPAESVFVSNAYNISGQLVSLVRRTTPDQESIGPVTHAWRYDNAGRMVAAVAADALFDSTRYDPAGNPVTLVTRRYNPPQSTSVAPIQMQYDRLNRLIQRILPQAVGTSHASSFVTGFLDGIPYGYTVPQDTHVFTYWPDGQLATASNCDAFVSRSYDVLGRLSTETLKIRTTTGSCGDWNAHVYGIGYRYDRDGRRQRVKVPSIFAAAGDSINYAYVNSTGGGAVTSIRNIAGDLVSLTYTERGELKGLTYPGGVSRALTYDKDGQLTTDVVNTTTPGFPRLPSNPMRSVTFTHDGRRKLLRATDVAGFQERIVAGYSGLGRVTSSWLHQSWINQWGAPVGYSAAETFVADPLGNETSSTLKDTTVTQGGSIKHSSTTTSVAYSAGVGRLTTRSGHRYRYDRAGNLEVDSLTAAFERVSYYGAAGRLRAVDVRRMEALDRQFHTFEQYRYDALGRRVWTWQYHHCFDNDTSVTCYQSHIRRTIWDGAQELAEIQAPGDSAFSAKWERDTGVDSLPYLTSYDPNPYFGRVLYTPGLAVDQPVSVTRSGYSDRPLPSSTYTVWPTYTVYPHWTSRGRPVFGTFSDGRAVKQLVSGGANCLGKTTPQRCAQVAWPAGQTAYDQRRGTAEAGGWHGTLLAQRRDGSGLDDKRNRQYDPETGRFTQEDPIGLAGGLNLYGFANGDPVNFSDPFGLCPPEDNNTDDCQADSKGAHRTSYCPAGSSGSPPNCRSLATSAAVAGSCPNVSGQEWDLGQQAIGLTGQTEEGFLIMSSGTVQRADGPDWTKSLGSIGPVGGRWPTNSATFVHSHPSGGGISPGDIGVASRTSIRIVSAGVGTNRYGSAQRAQTPVTCNTPQRPL